MQVSKKDSGWVPISGSLVSYPRWLHLPGHLPAQRSFLPRICKLNNNKYADKRTWRVRVPPSRSSLATRIGRTDREGDGDLRRRLADRHRGPTLYLLTDASWYVHNIPSLFPRIVSYSTFLGCCCCCCCCLLIYLNLNFFLFPSFLLTLTRRFTRGPQSQVRCNAPGSGCTLHVHECTRGASTLLSRELAVFTWSLTELSCILDSLLGLAPLYSMQHPVLMPRA